MDDVRYIILPGDLRKEERLTLGHIKIAMVLGAYSKRHGWTDLTQNDVGEMAGLTRQTVCSLVGELVEWGWVTRRKKPGKNQYVYRFIMDREDCQLEATVPQKDCQPQPTGNVGSDPTFIKEASSTLSQSPLRAGALATQSAARPALEVKAGDLSWSEWLEAIELHMGADARRAAAQLGKLTVPSRWPKAGGPMPHVEIVRDPTGEAA
jgi:hypothetical protein